MLRLRLNRIQIATKCMTKIALLLSVYYPFFAIPHHTPKSRKNAKNNKSQVAYDDLKLNENKVNEKLIRSSRARIKAHYKDGT